jgi:hypothetical protein
MDLRDLRYFETIAELEHIGPRHRATAPHAAGLDQQRAPAGASLRRTAAG